MHLNLLGRSACLSNLSDSGGAHLLRRFIAEPLSLRIGSGEANRFL